MKYIGLLLFIASFQALSASVPSHLTIQKTDDMFINTHYDDIRTIRTILTPTDCLTINAYHEGRGESDKGIKAIIGVVMNRKYDKRFPDTYCGVIFQRKQFSWINDNLSDKIFNIEKYKHIRKIVHYSLQNENYVRSLSNYSTFYATNSARPYWTKIFVRVVVIGNHSFYKG